MSDSQFTDLILYGTGVDSFLVNSYLQAKNRKCKRVYLNFGHSYSCREITFLKSNAKFNDIEIVDAVNLSKYETPSSYIPNRNVIAAIFANTLYPDISNIWIGGTLSDRVNDNNKDVMDKVSDILTTMHDRKITVSSPFWNLHKSQVIEDYIYGSLGDNNLSSFDRRKIISTDTYSCYSPSLESIIECDRGYMPGYNKYPYNTVFCNNGGNENKPIIVEHTCSKCSACIRKAIAMYRSGIYIRLRLEAIPILHKYYNESKICTAKHNDKYDNDIAMYERHRDTLKYVEYALHAEDVKFKAVWDNY